MHFCTFPLADMRDSLVQCGMVGFYLPRASHDEAHRVNSLITSVIACRVAAVKKMKRWVDKE